MQNFENLSCHQFQSTNMQELGIIACKKVLERGLRVIVNEPKSPPGSSPSFWRWLDYKNAMQPGSN